LYIAEGVKQKPRPSQRLPPFAEGAKVLAVSDIGGGWGFICNLDDLQK
jgi:hypothetical protein